MCAALSELLVVLVVLVRVAPSFVEPPGARHHRHAVLRDLLVGLVVVGLVEQRLVLRLLHEHCATLSRPTAGLRGPASLITKLMWFESATATHWAALMISL